MEGNIKIKNKLIALLVVVLISLSACDMKLGSPDGQENSAGNIFGPTPTATTSVSAYDQIMDNYKEMTTEKFKSYINGLGTITLMGLLWEVDTPARTAKIFIDNSAVYPFILNISDKDNALLKEMGNIPSGASGATVTFGTQITSISSGTMFGVLISIDDY